MMNLIPPGKNPFVETRDATTPTEEDEPSFSDPEDFVDEVTDEELLGDLLRDRPSEPERAEASCVVVDNVPQVGPERLDKLKKTMLRIFSQFGTVVSDFYPETEAGVTKGYAFLEYATAAEARKAAATADGLKLDRQHTFAVATLSDFDRYMTESESADWEPSEETQPLRDTGNLQHWLLDPDSCDQYSVIYEGGQRTAVFCCNVDGAAGGEPLELEDRQMWTESYVRWSPRGTYLATFHPRRGVALWGGQSFKQIQRFNHQGVTLADFSPCERYVVTYSQPPPPPNDSKEEPPAAMVIVWDIRSGLMKRTLQCDGATHTHWPVLKWSHDGSYVARMGQDALCIYETPSMGLLDKKSMKIAGVKDFSWSPADNVLAFWVPSLDNQVPARVALVQIPSRQEIAARKAFNVLDCKLHWQRGGDYLCVKMVKKPKGAQGVVTNFEIFRTREKLVPVDVVEMKESVVTFALEPNGSRLAVVHVGEASSRCSASVYNIRSNGGSVELLKTFAAQQANAIFWSPRGQFLVLAGLQGGGGGGGGLNGQLAFLDTSDCTMMSTGEHYTAGEVEWDPTGRYVATSVSWWQSKVDTAYWLWSFQGRLLQKNNSKERFCQMLWRPRPPTLLGDGEKAAIAKDLKRYSKVFEQKDRLSQSRASKEQVDRRRDAVDRYRQYRQRAEQEHRQRRDLRLKLRGNVDTDRPSGDAGGDTSDWEEETMEFFVGEERIPL